jgi:hypothetical protein
LDFSQPTPWHFFLSQCIYNRTVFKNGSCCTVRPGNVSCLQKFQHFWMIIRDIFFESGSTEATKIKIKNTAKVCHLYFWSNNSALFEHWNWKSPFKHRGWYVFARRRVTNLFFFSTNSLNYVKYFLTIWWNRHRRFQCKENMTVNALIFLSTGAFNIGLHCRSLYA